MMISIRKLGVFAATAGLLASFTLVGVGSASAGQDSPGLHSFTVEGQAPKPDYLPELKVLSAVQTPEQIEAVLEVGTQDAPVEALFDPATGVITAAFVPEPQISTYALSQLGPGCSTSSLCMKDKNNIPSGFIGSGILIGNWWNIVKVGSGDRKAQFKIEGIYGPILNTYVNVTLLAPSHVGVIQRF